MFLHPLIILVLLLLLGHTSCQTESSPAIELIRETEVVNAPKSTNSTTDVYQISWGNIVLPLEKYANPNGFRGKVEVERTVLLAALNEPLLLSKNAVPLPMEWHTLYNYTDSWRDPKWHPNPSADQRKLNVEISESLRQSVQKGDKLVLNIGSTNKEVYVAGAEILIKDPYQAYVPEKKVEWQRANEEPFGFQVISQDGKENVLRIDTAAETTAKVYKLYRDRKDYKIIHIPDFATQRRLLIDEDVIFSKYDTRRTELFNNNFDRWTLTEFTDYYRRRVQLDWGVMRAYANSENYAVATFLDNYQNKPTLKVGKRALPVLGFDLIIKTPDESAVRFVTDQLAIPEIQLALSKIPSRSSIYFTNLVVDDAGITKHFPLNFAFHIDDPLPFDLDVIEVADSSQSANYTAEQVDGIYQINYKNYRLSEVIAHLTDLKTDEVFFNQFERDPLVNICFASPILPLDYGKKAIQRSLQKEYNIRFNWSWYDYYQLTAVAPELLAGYRQSADPDDIRQFAYNLDNNTKIAQLNYADLDHLAWRVGNEFRIAIINTANIEGTYQLNLDMQSVADLQQNLFEQYGLELTKMTEEIKTVAYQVDIQ